MDPMLLRGVERILVVVFAGMSIYLGYRLFYSLPKVKDAEGKITFPGGGSVYLARIGPGAFFALFGAIVLGCSLYFSVTIQSAPLSPAIAESTSGSPTYTGAAQLSAPTTSASGWQGGDLQLLQLMQDMEYLNRTAPKLVRDKLEPRHWQDMQIVLRRAKLGLMATAWQPQWGQFSGFKQWVDSGEADPPPKQWTEPAEYFHHGSE